MGVMGGNCCGLARYQTVITLGQPENRLEIKINIHAMCLEGIGLIVADAALFMINIGNTWTQ